MCGAAWSNAATLTVVDTVTWYHDGDGDGSGDPNSTVHDCNEPANYVLDKTDCDDNDPNVNPDATETCNGIDDDCDGGVDENCHTWCHDADDDGYGDPNDSIEALELPPDYVGDCYDCDDSDPNINPDATEVCNGIDDDCDFSVDEQCETCCRDEDGDGYGDPAHSVKTTDRPAGCVFDCTDCDDSDPAVNPGASDACGEDRNCDGDYPVPQTWYRDADGDGTGDPNETMVACEQPPGYVGDAGQSGQGTDGGQSGEGVSDVPPGPRPCGLLGCGAAVAETLPLNVMGLWCLKHRLRVKRRHCHTAGSNRTTPQQS
jgi:hypothetical protein